MKKNLTPPSTAKVDNPWDDAPANPTAEEIREVAEQMAATAPVAKPQAPAALNAPDFDLEGLMTDFPTAKELERFVFDETGVVLNLKGRANKLKYQIAMDVLNGQEVDPKFIGNENPYIDRTELVPVEELKDAPPRDKTLPERNEVQNLFVSNQIPHTDFESRMQDKKVSVIFRKYKSGEISYEILGPVDQRPHGVKLDKYGRERPEVIKWVDPRSGEQTVVRGDGTLTPQGRKLRALMQSFKVNNSNYWDVWIDREFISLNDNIASNVWDLDK
jgi:hypothetical protein